MAHEEVDEGRETPEFWLALGGPSPALGRDFVPPSHRAKLHIMKLGEGYMELPQVCGPYTDATWVQTRRH